VATIERLGEQSGLWETTIRTDTEALTKKKLEYNAQNLHDFDAVLFFTSGEIGVHSASITFTEWPEFGEMIGGYFDEHPWGTFDAPILVEDQSFSGMQQWLRSFVLREPGPRCMARAEFTTHAWAR
jgi:type 1 glutamine amidotransferase